MTNIEIIREFARSFAERNYLVRLEWDEDDGQRYLVARNLELDGCMGHGDSADEAYACEREARVEYIEALLKRGLPVPDAQYDQRVAVSVSFADVTVTGDAAMFSADAACIPIENSVRSSDVVYA